MRISVVEFYLWLHEYFSSLCSLQRCPPRLQRPWRWKVRITNLGWWNCLPVITDIIRSPAMIMVHSIALGHSWYQPIGLSQPNYYRCPGVINRPSSTNDHHYDMIVAPGPFQYKYTVSSLKQVPLKRPWCDHPILIMLISLPRKMVFMHGVALAALMPVMVVNSQRNDMSPWIPVTPSVTTQGSWCDDRADSRFAPSQ